MSLIKRKHKPILFDAIKLQEQKKEQHPPIIRRRVLLYNLTITALNGIGRILGAVILSVIGSLIITAFVNSIANGTSMWDVLQDYWIAIVDLFKGGNVL